MDKTIITTLGLATIGAIYWFFFGTKEESRIVSDHWDIAVQGGYKPAAIRIPHGKPAAITFTRTDPNTCLEEVVMSDFKIKKFLPINTPVTIPLSPAKKGIYEIHCGMNMFHGKIVAV